MLRLRRKQEATDLIQSKLRSIDFSSRRDGLFTLEGHSEFAIRNSDFLRLDEERELGLSGHMRAKDEALTLRQSVMSCIDALDELILTVQPSSDSTVQIASELAQKYDKIRLFVYLPDVVPFSGSHVKSSDVPFPPDNSVHSYAHYSNFGLVRIRYKYYIKLDSDQIYFTQKLKDVRAAILGADMYKKKKNTTIFRKIIRRVVSPFEGVLYRALGLRKFCKFIVFVNARTAFSLCGLNLTLNKGDVNRGELSREELYAKVWGYTDSEAREATHNAGPERRASVCARGGRRAQLCLYKNLKNLIVPLLCKDFHTYNGGELPIFVPDSKSIYIWVTNYDFHIANQCRYISVLGVCWFHLGLVKRGIFADSTQMLTLRDYLNDVRVLEGTNFSSYGLEHRSIRSAVPNFSNDKHYIISLLQESTACFAEDNSTDSTLPDAGNS